MLDQLKDDYDYWKESDNDNILLYLDSKVGYKKIISNLKIPINRKKSVRIKNLLICPKGLVLITHINQSGKVYGDSKDGHWLIKSGTGGITTICNPIKELANNAIALEFLNMKNNTEYLKIYRVIFFDNQCDISDLRINTKNKFFVMNDKSELANFINKSSGIALTNNRINSLHKIFEYYKEF